ncbi:hypothetical protein [Arthrobacter sp. AD-310]
MKTEAEASVRPVDDVLIGTGSILCFLTVMLFVPTGAIGLADGFAFFSGIALGLLLIAAGYIKRFFDELSASAKDQNPLSRFTQ